VSIDFTRIKALVEQRDEFLSEHPELQHIQDEINEKLKGIKDVKERNRLLQEMLLNSWYRITEIKL
jgi:hypothetical protein